MGDAQPVGGFQRHGDGYAHSVVDAFARRLARQTSVMANRTNGAHCKASAVLDAALTIIYAASHGDVLCLHDGDYRFLNADRRATVGALQYWLPRWRDLGLEFVTIDEAVSLPAR